MGVLQISDIDLYRYFIVLHDIYIHLCMASDEHLAIHDLFIYGAASFILEICTREEWIWLRRLIEFSPPVSQEGTWGHRGVPTSKTLFDECVFYVTWFTDLKIQGCKSIFGLARCVIFCWVIAYEQHLVSVLCPDL